MRTLLLSFLFMLGASHLLQVEAQQTASAKKQVRTLIVFFDGLRPDYITDEAMPNLYAFKKRSAYGKAHHSVFPTVTRVNSSSYSTGSYPKTHGLMGNSVYFPEVNKTKSLNTGEAEDLFKIAEATHGQLLTTISLGEILQAKGERMMVFSSGSTGQALLQNHTVSGGAIINPAMILPASIKDSIFKDLGPVEPGGKHKWVTDALIRYGFAADGPLVSAIWYSDPDGVAHAKGIGSPEAMASIKVVDAEFGRIIASLQEKGLTDQTNILVSTDHGFTTYIGQQYKGLTELLIESGLKQSQTSDDIVTAGGAIYVNDHNPETIKKIVAMLRPLEQVGALFTRAAKPGDAKGFVEGTLSFETIHWNHHRSADILVDANWDDRVNSAGYAGAVYSKGIAAGHGTLSPWDVHIPLIVAGPAFRQGMESGLPTSNVDLAPTVLHILQLPVPASMDGRVMSELLRKPVPGAATKTKKETIETRASFPGGTYMLKLERTILGNYQYVDGAKTVRE
ncbi:MAG: alkaline phosphatase family protein [Candidatus Pseudobacter hemicellulosilyticus]|uniref:Alkaline phosphatase family protein n=1 Tax=Candidatus Pseudobacter hemicellulosilyticus TaxID=3121375 RepID=A0AAJ5WP20_9BACT|nr:MAG: alkaline phosphatase family protein [Pseudobacter sp.]